MAFQQIYIKQDSDEGPIDVPAFKDSKTGDIYTQKSVQKGSDDEGISYANVFENTKNGNIYEFLYDVNDEEYSYYPGKLIASGEALKNPDIQNFLNSYDWRGVDNPAAKYADVAVAQQLYDLKQSNPNAYYNQLATDLGNQIAENTAYNKGEHNVNFNKQLNQIKEVNPAAYYSAELGILGDSVGWQIGQNRSDRNAPTIEKIQSLIPDAMAAGLTNEQINSIVNNSANSANIQNQTRIANEAASPGGFNLQRDLVPALAIFGGAVGGAALGGAFSAAGAAGSGAGAGIGAGTSALDSTAIALGGSGGGGAFVPAVGSGASFGIVPGAAYTTGGLAGLGESALSTTDILNSTGFTPTTGSSFTVDPTVAYTTGAATPIPTDIGMGTNAPLQGPTYQELGVTGVEGGMAGPTYSELGYTGLNLEEAAAAADAASKGLSAQEVLSNANRVKNLAKLLGGQPTTTKATTGVNAQQLASLLGSNLPTQAAPGGIYRMNQNPFSFGTQGQTPVSQGMYDVSGTNPMANALRKA
jgi:hypothetical protein